MDQLKAAISQSLSDPAVADKLRALGADAVPALSASLERAMRANCGGQAMYIARRASRETLQERDAQLRQDFTGRNLAELTQRHGLSTRHARRILAHKPKK